VSSVSPSSATPALVTKVDRVWMLAPFKKTLERRARETTLLTSLGECIDRLLTNPTNPGLNLETLRGPAGQAVLSARIDRSFRLILTPLAAREIGLLHFDNHDEAYRWVDRNRSRIPTMLSRVQEIAPNVPISRSTSPLPVVQRDEEAPLALTSAAQWTRIVEQGIARYLAYLDEEQKRIAELHASGLLLVKGGAGTGKTAVAIHRALWLAQQPSLNGLGPSRVLYLCFNRALATAAEQIVRALSHGARAEHLEVRTIHAWCLGLINEVQGPLRVDKASVDAVRQRTFREFGRLTADQRAALAPHLGPFVYEEIERVIKVNGLADRAAYQNFNRRGRKIGLKQPARDAIWDIYEAVQNWQQETANLTWNDVPVRALKMLEEADELPRYRAVVIDEGQDCTPVMVRLARLLMGPSGQLTILADPAQEIYDCGFQWTQRELRTRGGNTRWLRKTYRTTREIFDLARPLLEDEPDLADDLAQLTPPERRGDRPVALVCVDAAELQQEIIERVVAATVTRPANQIGVVASNHLQLGAVATGLRARGIRHQLCGREDGDIRLNEPSVKLLTMHAVKGLDFPEVFVMAPTADERGWEADRDAECRRRLYVALTRSSDRLTIGLVYGRHHPLMARLNPACFEGAGTRGREFANTVG
jgi:superfamily I DNA/RNA helicase